MSFEVARIFGWRVLRFKVWVQGLGLGVSGLRWSVLREITNAPLWVFCSRTSSGFGARLVVFEVLPLVPSILGAVF